MNNDKYYANIFYGIEAMHFGIDGKLFINTVMRSAEKNKVSAPHAAEKMDWILETIQMELEEIDKAPKITESDFLTKIIKFNKHD